MRKYRGVAVFAEQRDGRVHPVTLELLGKGRELADRLGTELSAILLGYGMWADAEKLIQYGADRVFLFDHPELVEFDVLKYKVNIVELLEELKPEIFLIGATQLGRTLGPRVAAAMSTGLTADCIGLDVDEEGNLVQIRPAFSGNILAYIQTRTRPQMSTVRYRVMERGERDPSRRGEVVKRVPKIIESPLHLLSKERPLKTSITDAEVVVAGGRGLGKPSGFELLQDFADLVGGAVGASRVAVDLGWIGREHQVGFSGHVIKPKVYVACGISGSPQHLAGMRGSKIVIAINTDPSAPIFRASDVGIVGDVYKVIPKLMEKVKELKQKKGLA